MLYTLLVSKESLERGQRGVEVILFCSVHAALSIVVLIKCMLEFLHTVTA